MRPLLHLTISTPASVLADVEDVVALRAEDASGSFGVLPGHADLLTVLTASVLSWRRAAGEQGFCAVRGGIFRVADGRAVSVATREGVPGTDLATLQHEVLAELAAKADADRRARVEHLRLQTRAVRQLLRYLRPDAGRPREIFGDGDET